MLCYARSYLLSLYFYKFKFIPFAIVCPAKIHPVLVVKGDIELVSIMSISDKCSQKHVGIT